MHTYTNRGINVDLVTDIQHNFTWTLPLASLSYDNDLVESLENITNKDIEAPFAEIEQHDGGSATNIDPVIEGVEIVLPQS